MHKAIKNITPESFSKFGYVISHDSDKEENFQIVLREEYSPGWRIAVNKVTNKIVSKFGRHPDSMESFEPYKGIALICLAATETPEDYEVFLLDKPVCLFKNIWHGTLSLSEVSYLKITENLDVSSESYLLAKEVAIEVN